MDTSFTCSNCKLEVKTRLSFQRNHCPFCLFSKHLDNLASGDRKSICNGLMAPIGLTFKKSKNKYSSSPGELMIIHECLKCEKISINRLAADDITEKILEVFNNSTNPPKQLTEKLKLENIDICTEKDKKDINTQLFGKTLS